VAGALELLERGGVVEDADVGGVVAWPDPISDQPRARDARQSQTVSSGERITVVCCSTC
jgi:hypothetical protein